MIQESSTPVLAVAHLRDVTMGAEIVEYLERIDATLEPYGGRFLVHGGPVEVLEGQWSGDIIILQFPDRPSALAWYGSAEYQAILPLRMRNARGEVVLVDTVAVDHHATDILRATAARQTGS